MGKHPIQLYSLGTPNGVKVTILLEELVETDPNFDYDAWRIEISGDQVGRHQCPHRCLFDYSPYSRKLL